MTLLQSFKRAFKDGPLVLIPYPDAKPVEAVQKRNIISINNHENTKNNISFTISQLTEYYEINFIKSNDFVDTTLSNTTHYMGLIIQYLKSINPLSSKLPNLDTESQNKTKYRSTYNKYDESIIDELIYQFLFLAESNRSMDDNIINVSSNKTKGFTSWYCLQFVGITVEWKGFFQFSNLTETIHLLKINNTNGEYTRIIQALQRKVIDYSISPQDFVEVNEQLLNDIDTEIEDDIPPTDLVGQEGSYKLSLHKVYERDSQLRQNALLEYGLYCQICGFNFEESYGELGKGFIEVHHITPLHKLKGLSSTNSIEDLIPVCANCHRMFHRNKNNTPTPDEIKALIRLHSVKVK